MYLILAPHPDPARPPYPVVPYPVPIGVAETVARLYRAEPGRERAALRIVPA